MSQGVEWAWNAHAALRYVAGPACLCVPIVIIIIIIIILIIVVVVNELLLFIIIIIYIHHITPHFQ